MRRVGRLGARRRIMRRRPRPVWFDRLAAMGKIAAIPVAIFAAIVAAHHAGLTGLLVDKSGQMMLNASAERGMRVEHILINGEERTNHNILRSVLARHTGSIILSVDKNTLMKELQALPWVRSASVRVLLPDTLMIAIDEHQPFAWWRYQGGLHLVSDRGEVINPGPASVGTLDLPIIAGVGAPDRAGALFGQLRGEPDLFDRLTAAQLVGERRWNVYLDGTTEVALPAKNVKSAWQRLARKQDRDRLLERAVSRIDLRNEDWIILQLEESILSDGTRTKA